MPELKTLVELHKEHRQWLKMISFYEEDLAVLKKRLEEVSIKNTEREMHGFVERFQNKLIIQAEQIDMLRHDIADHEVEIVNNVEANTTATNRRKLEDHADMRERVQTFEILFNKLRKDLNAFVAKWM
ncbi:MAG TPA: hypothetical protein PLK15_08480 [Chitinophagales bacterium]|jgi:hypothetical protein|nr:hypothetical protein [Chitinophagales bacterium]